MAEKCWAEKWRSFFQGREGKPFEIDVDPRDGVHVQMGQQPARMDFKLVEPTCQSGDFQNDAGREQPHTLRANLSAINHYTNVAFDFPSEEIDYGRLIQGKQ